MNLNNELTSEADWDDNWLDFQPYIIKDTDQILGSNGAFIKTLERRFNVKPFSDVLELGGACSAYLCALSKYKSINASVIDYSDIGLSKTKRLFDMNGCKVDIFKGDLFTHNFSNNSFDIIVHWGLVEHFHDPIEIFKISSKILKKSGAVIFTMPNMEAFGVNLWQKYDGKDFDTHIFHSDDFIEKLAKESGFLVQSTYYWGPPLYFNAGYWFKNQFFLRSFFNLLIRLLSLLSRYFPIFNYGHKKISAHRAFILIKS